MADDMVRGGSTSADMTTDVTEDMAHGRYKSWTVDMAQDTAGPPTYDRTRDVKGTGPVYFF